MLTQRRTDFPHFMKILFLTSSCAILFHWNACVYFLFSLYQGLTEDDPNAFGFSYYKVFDPRFSICDVSAYRKPPKSPRTFRPSTIKTAIIQKTQKSWTFATSVLTIWRICTSFGTKSSIFSKSETSLGSTV